MRIREAKRDDFEQVWPIFHAVLATGDTHPWTAETTREEAFAICIEHPRQTWVVEEEGRILGAYWLRDNQPGYGDHVCNGGYIVAPEARGRGLGTAMCRHSQRAAKALGYRAMQYNLVVAANAAALRVWEKCGLKIVGRLPGAFRHAALGYVDAFVLYKPL